MRALILMLALLLHLPAGAQEPGLPEGLTAWTHASLHSSSGPERAEYVLGLGALQKFGGSWRHRHSVRLEGDLSRFTWQVNEAYTAGEGFEWWQQQIDSLGEKLFGCEGRSCGRSVQWADRVFAERLLYGHDDRQRYGAWRVSAEGFDRYLVLYASDRANRRHYIRLDVLDVERAASASAAELEQ